MDTALDQIVIRTTSRGGRPDTFGRFCENTEALLTTLRSAHHTLSDLTAVSARGWMRIGNDSSSLRRALQLLCFASDHPADYLNLSADGRLENDSLSRPGFSIACCSSGEASGSVVTTEKGGVDILLQGRSADPEPSSQAILELPTNEKDDLHDPAMVRRLLRGLIETWGGHVGSVTSRHYELAVKGTDRASHAGQWLFYLPFPGLAKCLPPDIRHEPFANGILIETTPHLPDANNPADIAAGKRVRDVLDEFGLINDATYAIEGWPPDPEESRYEQFISGAPAGRKYTVHCVNFDGYDPDRKVLLYAKLFRRLRRHPKEWGLRGWDGPVLNEAKRQVRAAAKAGGVPIEWHIGLEEPAHAVRQLVADHTTITGQQLTVIYTPLEQAPK
jgi:hypothetical protein